MLALGFGTGHLMVAEELDVHPSAFMSCVYSGYLPWVPRINLSFSGSKGVGVGGA